MVIADVLVMWCCFVALRVYICDFCSLFWRVVSGSNVLFCFVLFNSVLSCFVLFESVLSCFVLFCCAVFVLGSVSSCSVEFYFGFVVFKIFRMAFVCDFSPFFQEEEWKKRRYKKEKGEKERTQEL